MEGKILQLWLKKTGLLIKEKRQEKGWTALRLGKEIGMSQSAISNIEAGRQNIYASTLSSIAIKLNCKSIAELTPPIIEGDSKKAVEELFRQTIEKANPFTG